MVNWRWSAKCPSFIIAVNCLVITSRDFIGSSLTGHDDDDDDDCDLDDDYDDVDDDNDGD